MEDNERRASSYLIHGQVGRGTSEHLVDHNSEDDGSEWQGCYDEDSRMSLEDEHADQCDLSYHHSCKYVSLT